MLRKCGRLPRETIGGNAKPQFLQERSTAEFIRARRELGWSQGQAADYLGVSLTTVWRWECAEQRLPADMLLALALEAFGGLSIRLTERTGT